MPVKVNSKFKFLKIQNFEFKISRNLAISIQIPAARAALRGLTSRIDALCTHASLAEVKRNVIICDYSGPGIVPPVRLTHSIVEAARISLSRRTKNFDKRLTSRFPIRPTSETGGANFDRLFLGFNQFRRFSYRS